MQQTAKLIFIGAAVLGVFTMWSGFVDGMIFQPTPGVDLRPEQVGLAGEDVFLETSDGVRIHAFWLPAPESDRAVLFLHGNAGNASHRLPNAAEFVAMGASVLLLDYRGYGLSDGTPSEPGVYADARAGLSHLVEVRGFPLDRIVVFGRSVGGAVAVDLVQNQEIAGLILESPFPSVSAMASTIPLFRPAASLLRGRFDSESKIAKLRAPLLCFHGDRDEIVPFELGRRLFDAAPRPKTFEVIEGAGHNDTVEVGGREYLDRIRVFLDEVAPVSPERPVREDAS